MRGDVPLLPLYAFIARKWANLPSLYCKRDLVVKHKKNGHKTELFCVYLVTLKTCATNGNMHVRGGVELG